MTFRTIDFVPTEAWAQIATFEPADGEGVKEHHVMLHVRPGLGCFEAQLEELQHAYIGLLCDVLDGARVVMRRYLVSDIANQADRLRSRLAEDDADQGALSIIGQPPLDGTKVALWIYLTEGIDDMERTTDLTSTWHNGYRHLWSTNWQSTTGGSNTQTREILEGYEAQLAGQGLNIKDHCLRTWFFIRDVDTNYKGMVEARCNNFTMQHLTPDTHYIASTGIGGQPITTQSRVQMDGYAAEGLDAGQIQYLYAPTHLNPTYQYGVTFERGTAIHYGDRRHVLISGTASIDNHGQVLHQGQVEAQAGRMLENISTLLAEAGASLSDVVQAIVYLRDVADYELVNRLLCERLPQMPRVITLAPVCRPSWLIEMECMAVVRDENPRFHNF